VITGANVKNGERLRLFLPTASPPSVVAGEETAKSQYEHARLVQTKPTPAISGQVGLCFPGKVILEGRDRTAITPVEAQYEKSRDQVDPAEGANTGYLAPPRGNLCGAVSYWWSNEDSNLGPDE
jgi:hypothetical protein